MSGQEPPPQQQQPEAEAEPVEDYGSESEDEWLAPAKDIAAGDAAAQPRLKEINVAELDENERQLAGDAVAIDFHLPDGTVVRRSYAMGHTIEYIKGHLEDLFGLRYEATQLFMSGKLLIDPLSLNDLPFTAEGVNVVEVKMAG